MARPAPGRRRRRRQKARGLGRLRASAGSPRRARLPGGGPRCAPGSRLCSCSAPHPVGLPKRRNGSGEPSSALRQPPCDFRNARSDQEQQHHAGSGAHGRVHPMRPHGPPQPTPHPRRQPPQLARIRSWTNSARGASGPQIATDRHRVNRGGTSGSPHQRSAFLRPPATKLRRESGAWMCATARRVPGPRSGSPGAPPGRGHRRRR